MVKIKKLLFSVLAILPVPALANQLQFQAVAPSLEMSVVKDSLINALKLGFAPEEYYIFLEENNILSVHDLLEPENQNALDWLVKDWKTMLSDEIIMAGGYLSIGNGTNKGKKLL